MKRSLIGLLGFLLCSAASPNPLLESLMKELSEVTSGCWHYRELRNISTLNGPVTDYGTICYQRGAGGELLRRSDKPDGDYLTLNGARLTIGRPGNFQRVVNLFNHSDIAALVDAIRSTLEGDLMQLHQSYHVDFQGTLQTWTLILTPTNTAVAELLTRIIIIGHMSALRQIDILQSNGDNSSMAISP